MFEENNNIEQQDLLFRSILDEGHEPVPVHVWEGVEAGLNRISRRSTVMMWMRRTATGFAAAAALAAGIFIEWKDDSQLVGPAEDGMIAVIEPVAAVSDEPVLKDITANDAVAMAVLPSKETEETAGDIAETAEAAAEPASEQEPASEHEPASSTEETHAREQKPQTDSGNTSLDGDFSEFWEEDEDLKQHKVRTSLVLSGITGTNSAQNNIRVNPMKRPAISPAPKKTGIKETSTNTTYGVPVSFGAGVKIDFSPKWSVGAGINYTLLTRKFYGTYTEVGQDGSILNDVTSNIRESQHYIGIPVNVYYNIISNSNISLYTYAGGTAEKCIADKFQLLEKDIRHTEKVKGIQMSADLGIGAEFMIGRHLGIYIDPSLRYYFNCNQPKSIRTAQPLMFGLEMGLRARL